MKCCWCTGPQFCGTNGAKRILFWGQLEGEDGRVWHTICLLCFLSFCFFFPNFYANNKNFPRGIPPNEGRLFFNIRNSLRKRDNFWAIANFPSCWVMQRKYWVSQPWDGRNIGQSKDINSVKLQSVSCKRKCKQAMYNSANLGEGSGSSAANQLRCRSIILAKMQLIFYIL